MQFDPNHLSALAAVLRLGSFEAAAHNLSVTPSAVSQRIKALEERVGTALVKRGLPCTGTEAGLRLAKHAEDVAVLEGLISQELALDHNSQDAPPHLRIAVNADSLATWFITAMAATPGFLFDLVIDDQDHSAKWLKRGEVSAAITSHSAPVAGCNAQPLGAMRYEASASPTFMTRWFREGLNPTRLAQAPCLVFNAKDGLQQRWIRQHFDQDITPPAHFIPSTKGFADAAKAGLGWGMNPDLLVRDHIAAGRLVPLLPNSAYPMPLHLQSTRMLRGALAPFTRAVRRAAKLALPQISR